MDDPVLKVIPNINMFGLTTKKQIERDRKFRAVLRKFPPREIEFTVDNVPLKKGDRLIVKLPRYDSCFYIITQAVGMRITVIYEGYKDAEDMQ